MLRGPRSRYLKHADEVVGAGCGIALDVQEEDLLPRIPRRQLQGDEDVGALLANRERLERPLVAKSFPASVRAERVRELGDREDALLMRRREFSLLEPRHQAEVVGIDRAPSTVVAEAAGFAVPIDHEPRGRTRCQNAKSVHSSTCTANEPWKGDARLPMVGADDGDAVRWDFPVDVPDHESVEPQPQPVEIRDARSREDPNRHDHRALANALQGVRVRREILVNERHGTRRLRREDRTKSESNFVDVYSLQPFVELVVLAFGWRAPRKQVVGLQRALEKRFEYRSRDQESSFRARVGIWAA